MSTRGAYLLTLGLVPYAEALDLQRALAGAVSQGAIPETVVFLEHPPVVTIGRRTERGNTARPANLYRILGVSGQPSSRRCRTYARGTGIAAPSTTRPEVFSEHAREVVMAVVDLSSARPPVIDQDHLAQLALTLSRQLTRVTFDGLPAAIGSSLEQVGSAIGAERCRLIEFSDAGYDAIADA